MNSNWKQNELAISGAVSSLRVKLRGRGEHEGPWALRHAELGRPVGHAGTLEVWAGTPSDDQQAKWLMRRVGAVVNNVSPTVAQPAQPGQPNPAQPSPAQPAEPAN